MKPKKSGWKKKGSEYAPAMSIRFVVAVLFFILLFIYIFSAESKFRAAASWIWDSIIEMLRRAIGV